MPSGRARGKTVRLADQLHSTAIHLLRRLRREDDASGLPAPQLSAMSVIVFGGPITLGKLAEAEGVRPPTMTRLVDALVEAGLIARAVDPDDRRVVRVEATAKGKRLLEDSRGRRVQALVRELETLSDAELANVADAVTVLQRMLRRPGH